ncbi:MAG: biotin transporter BioY [Candidatus Omnitrophota bacterium]
MQAVVIRQARPLIKQIVFVLSFTLLMVVAAYVRIPLFFSPVPITFQTFILFLSIPVLKNKAYLPQLFYIILGGTGLPVFSNGGAGLIYLLGPTGGYLIGFILSTMVIGNFFFHGRKSSIYGNCLVFSLAIVFIYSLGVIWLIAVHNFSPAAAFVSGVAPFIALDALKIVVASFITNKFFRKW